MIKLRTIVILAAVSGICALLVVLASFVASSRPKLEDLNTETRSLLAADYSADEKGALNASPLTPIKLEIIQSAAKDEEKLAQTELRIAPAGERNAPRPLLSSFETKLPKAPEIAPASSATQVQQSVPAAATPAPKPARARPSPTATKATYSPLTATACSLQYLWRSVNSITETSVLFSNRSRDVIRVYRLGFNGGPEFEGEIKPGAKLVVETYVTHPWVVTDSGNNCLGVYSPKVQPGSVTID